MKTKIEGRACECEIQWEHWSKWDTVVDRPWFSRFASPPPPSHTHTTTLLESNTTTLLECNTWSCQGSSADKRAVGSLGGAWLRESKIGRKSETAGGPSLREVPILLARHLLYFFHFLYCQPNTIFLIYFFIRLFIPILSARHRLYFFPPILSAWYLEPKKSQLNHLLVGIICEVKADKK